MKLLNPTVEQVRENAAKVTKITYISDAHREALAVDAVDLAPPGHDSWRDLDRYTWQYKGLERLQDSLDFGALAEHLVRLEELDCRDSKLGLPNIFKIIQRARLRRLYLVGYGYQANNREVEIPIEIPADLDCEVLEELYFDNFYKNAHNVLFAILRTARNLQQLIIRMQMDNLQPIPSELRFDHLKTLQIESDVSVANLFVLLQKMHRLIDLRIRKGHNLSGLATLPDNFTFDALENVMFHDFSGKATFVINEVLKKTCVLKKIEIVLCDVRHEQMVFPQEFSFDKLEVFCCRMSKMNAANLSALLQRMPNLTKLTLFNISGLNDEVVFPEGDKSFNKLEELDLGLSSPNLENLRKFLHLAPNLKTLYLSYRDINDEIATLLIATIRSKALVVKIAQIPENVADTPIKTELLRILEVAPSVEQALALISAAPSTLIFSNTEATVVSAVSETAQTNPPRSFVNSDGDQPILKFLI